MIRIYIKTNISKWLDHQINESERALLRAEDELAEAHYRVKAYSTRLARLKGKRAKMASADVAADPRKPRAVIPSLAPQVGESTADFMARFREAGSKS
jgi:hypothetical protein